MQQPVAKFQERIAADLGFFLVSVVLVLFSNFQKCMPELSYDFILCRALHRSCIRNQHLEQ